MRFSLRNAKLKTKLIGGFLVVVVLTLIGSGVAFWGMDTMSTAAHEAVQRAKDANTAQASNATQISEAIQGIAQVTEQAAAGSEEMASSSEELGAQASALQTLVSRFKTDNSSSSFETSSATETATV